MWLRAVARTLPLQWGGQTASRSREETVAVSDTGGFRRTGSSGGRARSGRSRRWCTEHVLRWARMALLRVAEDNWYNRAGQWVVVLLLWRLLARLTGGRQAKVLAGADDRAS
jgi:hypothetical protein